jgi:hypothetical protein
MGGHSGRQIAAINYQVFSGKILISRGQGVGKLIIMRLILIPTYVVHIMG